MTEAERLAYNAERRERYAQTHLKSKKAQRVSAGWARRRDPKEQARLQAEKDIAIEQRIEQQKRLQERRKYLCPASELMRYDRTYGETGDHFEYRNQLTEYGERERRLIQKVEQLERRLDAGDFSVIGELQGARRDLYKVRRKYAEIHKSRKVKKNFESLYPEDNLIKHQSRYDEDM